MTHATNGLKSGRKPYVTRVRPHFITYSNPVYRFFVCSLMVRSSRCYLKIRFVICFAFFIHPGVIYRQIIYRIAFDKVCGTTKCRKKERSFRLSLFLHYSVDVVVHFVRVVVRHGFDFILIDILHHARIVSPSTHIRQIDVRHTQDRTD